MGAERTFVATAIVRAPREAVWELLSDTSRYHEYVPGTVEVTRSDGQARLGATYDERNKIVGPITARSHWEVVEFDPPHRQLHRGEGIAIADAMSIELATTPQDQATEVTFTLRITPGLGPIGELLSKLGFEKMVDRDNRRSVENFRVLAERELGGSRAAA